MAFTSESNLCTPRTPRALPKLPPTHSRSSSISSAESSNASTSSSTSSNSGLPLRQRRGVTFRLSFTGGPAPDAADVLSPKDQVESDSSSAPRRRRALPMPVAVFDYDSVMGKAGAKSARARDYGMGQDGWAVVMS